MTYPGYEIDRFESEGGSCSDNCCESEFKLEPIPVIDLEPKPEADNEAWQKERNDGH